MSRGRGSTYLLKGDILVSLIFCILIISLMIYIEEFIFALFLFLILVGGLIFSIKRLRWAQDYWNRALLALKSANFTENSVPPHGYWIARVISRSGKNSYWFGESFDDHYEFTRVPSKLGEKFETTFDASKHPSFQRKNTEYTTDKRVIEDLAKFVSL